MASEEESLNRRAILEALERRSLGRPVSPQALIKRARQFPDFARAWLAHAMGSSAGTTELAVTLALTADVQPEVIDELHALWTDVACRSGLEVESAESAETFLTLLSAFELAGGQSDRTEQCGRILRVTQSLSRQAIPGRSERGSVKRFALPVGRNAIDALVAYARPRLEPAGVYGRAQRDQHEQGIRDSDQAVIAAPSDSLVLSSIERLVALACGQALVRAEPMAILRYRPGQQYRWHRDYIQASSKTVRQELAQVGQRVYTGILYLSDDFTGGQTEFRDWDLSLRVNAGECVGFSNVDADGQPDPASIHRGAPVESGEKWIGTLWFRSRPLWNRQGLIPVQDAPTT